MKRFIVIGNSMALDVSPGTPHVGMVPPDNGFIINAPDYVFEGWGYDARKVGDERFIKPRPPCGWAYDPETGTVYRTGEVLP
jgi:hypothetical protein